MIVAVARIKAAEGCADEVTGYFAEMVEWVAENEPATITYVCNRSVADGGMSFLFFERYEDQAAFEAHSASERFGELVRQLQGKLDGGMKLDLYEEVAAKI
jgi:quinol monooxygenase YgiN